MTLYTQIFSQSWKLTKQNPVLWVLGVFIVFWADRSIDFEQVFSSSKLLQNAWSPFRPEFWDLSRWAALTEKVAGEPQFFAPFILIMIALGAFVLLMITAAHVGIIDAVSRKVEQGYSFVDALRSTERSMIHALAIQCINKVVMYACVMLASLVFFFDMFGEWKVLAAFGVLLATWPATIALSIVSKYALIDTVTQHHTTREAYAAGWNMFRANVGVSLEMGIMMMMVFAAANLSAIVLALVVLSPVFIGASLIAITSGFLFPLYMHSMMVMVVTMGCFLALASFFSAWHLGNWTLLYEALQKEPRRSKTHRLLRKQKQAE